jgi:hypothetical protein
MAVTSRSFRIVNYRSVALGWLAAAVISASILDIASAQNNQTPPAAASTTPPAAASAAPPAAQQGAPGTSSAPSASAFPSQPPPKRGFLNDLSEWWDKSVSDFGAKMKEQQSKLDDFNKQQSAAAKDVAAATSDAMKKAADAMTHLSPSKVLEVHEVCAVAGNGAADCATAATNVCKGKGFNDGQPLDVRTADKCNASLWVSGQNPATAQCPVETVVLRVACQ